MSCPSGQQLSDYALGKLYPEALEAVAEEPVDDERVGGAADRRIAGKVTWLI